jgi:hypothetical protein
MSQNTWRKNVARQSTEDSYGWAVVPLFTVDTIRTRPPLSTVAIFDSR